MHALEHVAEESGTPMWLLLGSIINKRLSECDMRVRLVMGECVIGSSECWVLSQAACDGESI